MQFSLATIYFHLYSGLGLLQTAVCICFAPFPSLLFPNPHLLPSSSCLALEAQLGFQSLRLSTSRILIQAGPVAQDLEPRSFIATYTVFLFHNGQGRETCL